MEAVRPYVGKLVRVGKERTGAGGLEVDVEPAEGQNGVKVHGPTAPLKQGQGQGRVSDPALRPHHAGGRGMQASLRRHPPQNAAIPPPSRSPKGGTLISTALSPLLLFFRHWETLLPQPPPSAPCRLPYR